MTFINALVLAFGTLLLGLSIGASFERRQQLRLRELKNKPLDNYEKHLFDIKDKSAQPKLTDREKTAIYYGTYMER